MKKITTTEDKVMVKENAQEKANLILREMEARKVSSKLDIHVRMLDNLPLSEEAIEDLHFRAVSSRMLDNFEYLLMRSECVNTVVRERVTKINEFKDELHVYLNGKDEPVIIQSLDSTYTMDLELLEYK